MKQLMVGVAFFIDNDYIDQNLDVRVVSYKLTIYPEFRT